MLFERFENKIPPKITHYTVCKNSSYCGGHFHLVISLQILKQHAYGSCITDSWCIHTGSHTIIITIVTYIHAIAINSLNSLKTTKHNTENKTWQYRAYKGLVNCSTQFAKIISTNNYPSWFAMQSSQSVSVLHTIKLHI